MLAKIYWYTWLALALVFTLLFVSGNMTDLALVVFGLTAFGMTFMRMISVLPATENQISEAEPAGPRLEVKSPALVSIQHGVRYVRG